MKSLVMTGIHSRIHNHAASKHQSSQHRSTKHKPNVIAGKIVTHIVKTRARNGEIHLPRTTMGRAFAKALREQGVRNVVV